MHPAGLENTAILQFNIKITKIPHEKLTNTANPNVPLSYGGSRGNKEKENSTEMFHPIPEHTFECLQFLCTCLILFHLKVPYINSIEGS